MLKSREKEDHTWENATVIKSSDGKFEEKKLRKQIQCQLDWQN